MASFAVSIFLRGNFCPRKEEQCGGVCAHKLNKTVSVASGQEWEDREERKKEERKKASWISRKTICKVSTI